MEDLFNPEHAQRFQGFLTYRKGERMNKLAVGQNVATTCCLLVLCCLQQGIIISVVLSNCIIQKVFLPRVG